MQKKYVWEADRGRMAVPIGRKFLERILVSHENSLKTEEGEGGVLIIRLLKRFVSSDIKRRR